MSIEQMTPDGPVQAPRRIAVCLPTRDSVDYQFAVSLAEMFYTVGATIAADGIAEMWVIEAEGTLVDTARDLCVLKAMRHNPTHLLWLDSDMLFPRHTLHKLMAANADIVGVNYSTRRPPCQPTAYKTLPDKATGYPGEKCFTTNESTGYEEVEAVGFGCVLMRADIFNDIERPAFEHKFLKETKNWVGEDIDFCFKARQKGYKVLVDHDLSKEIGHAGRFVYTNPQTMPVAQIVAPTAREVEKVTNGPRLVH